MQKQGKVATDVADDVFSKPFRNWNTRTTLRPGTRTRVSTVPPSQSLEIEEIAARIKFGRF